MRLVVAGLVLVAAAAAQPRAPGPVSATPGRLPGMAPRNIIHPGTPGRSAHGRITSPGLPTPRRPTSVITPGTPAPARRPMPARIGSPEAASHEPHHEPHHAREPRLPFNYLPYSYAYPIFGYGGGYGYGYGYNTPDVIAVSPNQSALSSARHVITVGGDPAGRQISARGSAPAPNAPADNQVYYLIALNGGLIYAAESYAVEGGALRFTTVQGEEYVLSLAEVDRAFTRKLNRDRGVDLDLESR